MLELSNDQRELLSDSHEQRIVATSFYDGESTYAGDLPVVGGEVTFDDDAAVQKAGKLMFADPDGALVPTTWDSPLSPYGSRLYLEYEAKLGNAVARIPLGWFRIDTEADVDESMTQYANGRWVHQGALVTVPIIGLLSLVDRHGFEAPEQAPAGALVWDEIRRLAIGMQITTSYDENATVPSTFTYADNRLDALNQLAAIIGGVIFEDVDGTVSVRTSSPDTSAPVWDLKYGPNGRITAAKRSLKIDKFYNVFISKSSADEGSPIQARTSISEGPLREGGPMGTSIYTHASPLITTYAMALADAETTKARMTSGQPVSVPLSCLPCPALQGLDPVSFDYYDRNAVGLVKSWTLPHSGVMTLNVETIGGADPWA